jgi:uncharacterized hydrophobic protein (TIGR00271 family)
MSQDLKNSLLDILRYRFNLDEDKANEDEIKETLKKNVEFRGTNLWALIFAIFVASIGLNVNSTAVIIGAMLISPLMGPIMGVGLGAGVFDFALIRYSLKNLLVAVIISVAASAVYFWLSPLKTAQPELLARTSPTIWDVLIALFGGLAGIVASSRKNISNAIPGVAISTALMPPLCTAGYGLGTGNLYYFLGAFYLFLINSVFISIATFLIIRFLKFKPVVFINQATEIKVRRYIWVIAVLTILPSLYLAYNFVQQEIFKQNLRAFLHEVVEHNNYYVINENINTAKQQVSWLVYGEKPLDSLKQIIDLRQKDYALQDAEFKLRQTLNVNATAKNNAVRDNESPEELESHTAMLIEKDKMIKSLEARLKQRQKADTSVYREFVALFGKVHAFGLQKAVIWDRTFHRESVLLVYIKKKGRFNIRQAQAWLQARFQKDSVVLTVD